MGFIEAVRSAFANYFNFKDRTSRAGYWWFVLFQLILGALATVIDVALFGARVEDIGPASGLVTLAIFIPAITAGTRRLHDTGRTGWWQLIAFTVIGIVPLIYWACQPGDHGTNAHGPPPK